MSSLPQKQNKIAGIGPVPRRPSQENCFKKLEEGKNLLQQEAVRSDLRKNFQGTVLSLQGRAERLSSAFKQLRAGSLGPLLPEERVLERVLVASPPPQKVLE